MKTEEFHKPFISALVIVALVTVFAMFSTRYLFKIYHLTPENHNIFTSVKSDVTDK